MTDPRALVERLRAEIDRYSAQLAPDRVVLNLLREAADAQAQAELELDEIRAALPCAEETTLESVKKLVRNLSHTERVEADLAAARVALRDAQALLAITAPCVCPHCGPHAKIDEDGCCVACGCDTHCGTAWTGDAAISEPPS